MSRRRSEAKTGGISIEGTLEVHMSHVFESDLMWVTTPQVTFFQKNFLRVFPSVASQNYVVEFRLKFKLRMFK